MKGRVFCRLIITILFYCFWLTSYAETNSKDSATTMQQAQVFYQKPSYENFIDLTTKLINEPKTENFLIIFSTMVVDKHPDYVAQISKNFMNYTPREKQLLAASLLATNHSETIDAIQKNDHFTNSVSPRYTADEIKNLQVDDDPHHLDALWTAYFATGDDAYLMRLLQYINADHYMLITGYEIMNRNYLCDVVLRANKENKDKKINTDSLCKNNLKDIIEAIQKKYPENSKQILYKAIVTAAAIWSMDANRRQDSVINEKINKMIKENPNLDYWKTIKSAIH